MTEEHDDGEVVFVRDAAAIIVAVVGPVEELLGWSPQHLVGRPSTEFIHPDDYASAVTAWMDMLGGAVSVRWEGRYRRTDGRWRWVATVHDNNLDRDGTVHSVMSPIEAAGVGIADELRAREQLFMRLTEALPVGVVQFDRAGTVVFTNQRLHAVLGGLRAATIDALFREVVAEDQLRVHELVATVLRDEPVNDVEVRMVGPLKRVVRVSARALTDVNGDVTGAVACLADSTEQARQRDELHWRAETDPLTRCLNREAIVTDLTTRLGDGAEQGVAVFFVDLDSFKHVNDRHGHAAGDAVLRTVADRVRRELRPDDRIGRLGGDEFLVVCGNVKGNAEAATIRARLVTSVNGPVQLTGASVDISATIGVAWTDQQGTAAELIALADEAMYRDKPRKSQPA